MNYVKLTVFLPVTKKVVLKRQYKELYKLRDQLFSLGVFDVDWIGSDMKKDSSRLSDIYIDLTIEAKHRVFCAKRGYAYLHRTLDETGYILAIFNNELEKAVRLVKKKASKLAESRLPALYHLSFDNNLPVRLDPRQPYGSEVDKSEGDNDPDLAEDLPPRVSFSSSIEGCFRAITPNIMNVIEEARNRPLLFRVYMLSSKTTKYNSYNPADLTYLKKIHDAQFTQEYCFMKTVYVSNIADIEVRIDRNKKITYGPHGNLPVGEDTGWAYDISYDVLKIKSGGFIDLHKYDFYFKKIV